MVSPFGYHFAGVLLNGSGLDRRRQPSASKDVVGLRRSELTEAVSVDPLLFEWLGIAFKSRLDHPLLPAGYIELHQMPC